jgi:hypothetical protein
MSYGVWAPPTGIEPGGPGAPGPPAYPGAPPNRAAWCSQDAHWFAFPYAAAGLSAAG